MGLAQLFEDWPRQAFTLLGVGPMSITVVDASIECAIEHGAPMVFIPSRNQVGHGNAPVPSRWQATPAARAGCSAPHRPPTTCSPPSDVDTRAGREPCARRYTRTRP